jgi:DDE superfamily endonuclease
MGFKQSHPSRTYNLSCNHRRQILHTTKGHPSRWNDKTLAYQDEFLTRLRKGEILQDVVFHLFSKKDGNLVETKYRGAWGLVDNGYHKWSFIQAPAKSHLYKSEQRLSQWMESLRKDAECVFGILKGRFRILKTGIRVEGTAAADSVWLTCCALHNFLLHVDGLSEQWRHDVPSDYKGELGHNDPHEVRQLPSVPFAIARLDDESVQNFGSHEHMTASVREEEIHRLMEGQLAEQEQPDDDAHLPAEPIIAEDGGVFR